MGQDRLTGFNPVLGFLPASTPPSGDDRSSTMCFNPVLGFLPASTAGQMDYRRYHWVFQSRSGFSPCLDQRLDHKRGNAIRVSIPFWVFSLPRLAVAVVDGRDGPEFQSRSGFSPCLDDPLAVAAEVERTRFNPVLGFLPASTQRRTTRRQ